MDDNLNITIERDFILVVTTQTAMAPVQPGFFSRILEAARDAGVSKILCDFSSVIGELGTMERFEYASIIAKQFRGVKVAFVLNRHLMDPGRFGENVAVNRGAYFRVLGTRAEAYEWLDVAPPQTEP